MSYPKKILLSAMFIFFGGVSSSILGLLREVLSAKFFGISYQMDAYIYAYTIPSVILAFIGVFFSAGFIPIYIKERDTKTKEETAEFLNAIINLLLIVLLVVTVMGCLFSNQIAKLFSENTEEVKLINSLILILFPSIIMFGLSYIQSAILNSYNNFKVSSFLPFVNNLVVIISILLLHSYMSVRAIAIGFLCATILQVLLQVSSLKKLGINYKVEIKISKEKIASLLMLVIPITALTIADQIIVIATRIFATKLDTGMISALNYANRLMLLPITLIGSAFVNASFPTLVEYLQSNLKDELKELIEKNMRIIIIILLPVTLFIAFFSQEIVRLLLERGVFNKEATKITSNILSILSISILILSFKNFYFKIFFSDSKFKEPLVSSVIFLIVFLLFGFIFINSMGVYSIAFANVLAALISFFYLERKLSQEIIREQLRVPFKLIILTSIISIILILITKKLMVLVNFHNNLAIVGVGTIYLIMYLLVLKVLKIKEVDLIMKSVRKK